MKPDLPPVPPPGHPRGFALLSVLLALFVFVALGAISVGLAVREHRMARIVMDVAEARGLVEQDITQAFESLDPAVLAEMAVGSTAVDVAEGEGTVHRVELHRAGDDVFLIAAAVDVQGGPYRGEGLVVRLVGPQIGLRGPMSSGGPVRVGSGTTFAVVDTEVDADCEPGSATVVPPAVTEPVEDRSSWAGRTSVLLPDGLKLLTPGPKYLSQECLRADPVNWGDPARPNTVCGRYLPVVRAPGDLEVDGGVGQGVLLVDGDLTLRGGVEFHGVILVGGTLSTTGSGARVYGTVQIDDPDEEGSGLDGGAVFTYSPCAIGRSLRALGGLETGSGRSWIGTY